jgi:membrane protease subunit HflC
MRPLVWAIVIVALLAIIVPQFVYVVGEAEQAVRSRMGVIAEVITSTSNDFHTRYPDAYAGTELSNVKVHPGSGLLFKTPFIDNVQKFSARMFTYVSDSEIVNTSEKKQYYLTVFAQWRIVDPALFSLAFGIQSRVETYLDNLITPVVVQAINRLPAEDFISNKDVLNQALANGLTSINDDMRRSGIEIVDIQVHRTILPPANIQSTYARMTADRAKVAQQLRSEGEEAYRKSVAEADLEVKRLQADAVAQAGRIRGEADAEAMQLYADAYAKDADFFEYWRSLDALKSSFEENTTLMLDSENPLLKGLLEAITE